MVDGPPRLGNTPPAEAPIGRAASWQRLLSASLAVAAPSSPRAAGRRGVAPVPRPPVRVLAATRCPWRRRARRPRGATAKGGHRPELPWRRCRRVFAVATGCASARRRFHGLPGRLREAPACEARAPAFAGRHLGPARWRRPTPAPAPGLAFRRNPQRAGAADECARHENGARGEQPLWSANAPRMRWVARPTLASRRACAVAARPGFRGSERGPRRKARPAGEAQVPWGKTGGIPATGRRCHAAA